MHTLADAAAVFTKWPGAQAVLLDMGHGYGKLKYTSKCPFTGAEICRGDDARRIHVTTRDGKTREGYTSNRVFGFMRFGGDSPAFSWNVLPGSEWPAHRDALIADLDNIQKIVLRSRNSISVETTYGWDGKKWCGARWKSYSVKQFASILRRNKSVCIYHTTKREETKA